MRNKKNNTLLKYLYIDLINGDKYIDIDQLFDFIDSLNMNPELIFIFNYNCLDYPEIDKVINFLVNRFKDFILKCESFEQLEKLESYNNIINELRVKINPILGKEKIEHKITNNTKLFNYLIDFDKSNVLNFGIDLYINNSNIISLKETLKELSKNDFESKIIFEEYPLNSYYYTHNSSSKALKDDYNTELLLDNIINDNTFKIINKDYIMYMLQHYMQNRCWRKYYPIQLCLGTDFKLRICQKIDISLNLNPFDCFENGNLKDEVFDIIKEKCSKYCLGCNCEDFITEILER